MPTPLKQLIAEVAAKSGADDGCSSIASELIALAENRRKPSTISTLTHQIENHALVAEPVSNH